MFKIFTLKSPIATKEICISKQKDDLFYLITIVAYESCYSKQCKTLKDCFNYIRETFNIKKGKENG